MGFRVRVWGLGMGFGIESLVLIPEGSPVTLLGIFLVALNLQNKGIGI